MRWKNLRGSGNVEDRRARPGGRTMAGGAGGIGVVGLLIFLAVQFLGGGGSGIDPSVLEQLQPAGTNAQSSGPEVELTAEEQEYEEFVTKVIGDTDFVWDQIFTEAGLTYQPPRLVLFRTSTQSGCGGANSQVGPHYCPLDDTIYIDETFFDAVLEYQLGAQGGDFAEAYVIAHEVGHHVQNELGINQQVRTLQQQNPQDANELSVLMELQADCFAGVWAHSVAALDAVALTRDDIREALDAAATVGDDRIQQTTQGRVNPEAWTHGSAEQRVDWFTTGYETGDANQCNTFD